jgi:3-deoxy-7-phosphoheptulonate synthase
MPAARPVGDDLDGWSPASWRDKACAQAVNYDDDAEVALVASRIAELPPLVTSWEIERLRALVRDAQDGRRFLLQGGDCAETIADCRPGIIANKLKILLQMSLVLIHGAKCPVIRVGRFAGQYAKPRSSATETKDGVTLPSYFGDLVNRPAFSEGARRADPQLMLSAYHHAASTLNFIRSLSGGGFADLHHPEYWDLAFFENASLPASLREEYQRTSRQLSEALRFMEALGERPVDDLTRVEFYTSHEALNLHYESAQTRAVPRRQGSYLLSAHLPWIGERTRQLDGAHVELLRGVRNPVGVKLGPKVTGAEACALIERLNPTNERGKVVLITRCGAANVARVLPPLVQAVQAAELRVLWVCDPMHGNTKTATSGLKTRDFDDILHEIECTQDVHRDLGTYLGGVHFELTGEDVTECVGGAAGITEDDLDKNYASVCDPRLNYRQALEMSFRIARRMPSRPTTPPPA